MQENAFNETLRQEHIQKIAIFCVVAGSNKHDTLLVLSLSQKSHQYRPMTVTLLGLEA